MENIRITVSLNGPYIVEGCVDVVDQEGNSFSLSNDTRIVLCRCGRSSNKPFCDGTHRKNEPLFDAPTRAT